MNSLLEVIQKVNSATEKNIALLDRNCGNCKVEVGFKDKDLVKEAVADADFVKKKSEGLRLVKPLPGKLAEISKKLRKNIEDIENTCVINSQMSNSLNLQMTYQSLQQKKQEIDTIYSEKLAKIIENYKSELKTLA